MAKITKRTVDGADIRTREYTVWDTTFPGFGLRVFPSGVKSYVFQYRKSGHTRKVAIGLHGHWTPEKAYRKAVELRWQVNDGHDPSAERKQLSTTLTIAELCDIYLENGCIHKKSSTILIDRGRILRHIKPVLGKLRVTEIDQTDIGKFMKAVSAGKTARTEKTKSRGLARVRGGPGTARRTLGLLGGILTFAVKEKLRPDNPVKGVFRAKDGKRERFLTNAEMVRLGEILGDPEALNLNPAVAPAILLLILTGCRKGEILTLKWSEVDLVHKYLHLRDSKTGARKIVLNEEAVSILRRLNVLKGNEFVFPATVGKGHFTALQDGWEKIRTVGGFTDVRLHDLRHTFATALASTGSSLLMISKLLGHRDQRTTQIYAHLIDSSQHQASQMAANAMSVIWAQQNRR